MPKFETRARVELHARTRHLTQEKMAEVLGCSQPMISDYLSGESRPNPDRRQLALAAWGIKLLWWLTPEEGGPEVPSDMGREGDASAPHPQDVRARRGRRGRVHVTGVRRGRRGEEVRCG